MLTSTGSKREIAHASYQLRDQVEGVKFRVRKCNRSLRGISLLLGCYLDPGHPIQ